ncbi:MAG: DUF4118 domain-containing protein, partial [Caulobacteraceae bacterium]
MVGLIVRLLLDPYLDHRALVIIYVPAVLAAALVGGAGPAILATVLSLGISAAFLRQDVWRPDNAID